MRMEVYDKENKKVEEIEVSEKVFGAKWNPSLVHQVSVSERANSRTPYAAVKDRSEVRGGGKKPWAQKGLGRARHGSIRSPIWAGGGVTHGPRREEDFSKKINKKMKQAALFAVISKKVKDGEVRVIDDLNVEKTGIFAGVVGKFFNNKKTSLLVVPGRENKVVVRAARNIPKTEVKTADSLSVSDFLNHRHIFLEKAAVKEIEK